MSLIKCPECGKNISDTCEYCVHCGFRLKSKIVQETQTKKKKSSFFWRIVFWIFLIFLVKACISDEKPTTQVEQQDYRPLSEQNSLNAVKCNIGLGQHDLNGNHNYYICICKEMSGLLSKEAFEKVTKCADTDYFENCLHKNFEATDWYDIAKSKCSDYK